MPSPQTDEASRAARLTHRNHHFPNIPPHFEIKVTAAGQAHPFDVPRGDCSSRRLSPRGPFELSASESELVAVQQRVRVKCAPDAVAKRFQRALGVGIRTGNGFQNQKRSTAFDDFGGTEQGKFSKAFQGMRLEQFNHQLREDLPEPLRIGIGIHYGEAIVGAMGPPRSQIVTAIGDTVNTCARLEA